MPRIQGQSQNQNSSTSPTISPVAFSESHSYQNGYNAQGSLVSHHPSSTASPPLGPQNYGHQAAYASATRSPSAQAYRYQTRFSSQGGGYGGQGGCGGPGQEFYLSWGAMNRCLAWVLKWRLYMRDNEIGNNTKRRSI
jgi:hypothetical protein